VLLEEQVALIPSGNYTCAGAVSWTGGLFIITPSPCAIIGSGVGVDSDIGSPASRMSKKSFTAGPKDTSEEATPEERTVTVEDKVYKKRYDDLKRHYDSTLNKSKDEILKLKKIAENASKRYVPPKSKEELDAWRKEYPDVYDAVKQIAYEQADEKSKEVNSKLTELEKRQAEVLRQKAEVELARAHPDFSALRESQDFHDWASTQDSTIQSWLYDNVDNSKLVVRAIDLYKMDRGMTEKSAPKSKKDDAAKAVTKTKSGDQKTEKRTWKLSEIQRMRPSEFDRYEKEIDLARKEGRVIQG
jgi:hypothetical protein